MAVIHCTITTKRKTDIVNFPVDFSKMNMSLFLLCSNQKEMKKEKKLPWSFHDMVLQDLCFALISSNFIRK